MFLRNLKKYVPYSLKKKKPYLQRVYRLEKKYCSVVNGQHLEYRENVNCYYTGLKVLPLT